MNNSSCTPGTSTTALTVFSASNGVSLLVCACATATVCALKLYRKSVYRLALYQVFAALCFTTVCVFQAIFVNYDKAPEKYYYACVTVGFLNVLLLLIKVLLTVWLTFHFACFALFLKDMKKLEPLYVVSSLIISTLFAIVPFTTRSYGLAGYNCWIQDWEDNCPSRPPLLAGVIEQIALWYAPAVILLFVESITMFIILVVLARRAYRRTKLATNLEGRTTREDKNWKALKQLMPLASYPVLFCLFNIPPISYRVYGYTPHSGNGVIGLEIGDALSVASWSFSVGVSLLVHISLSKRKHVVRIRNVVDDSPITIEKEGAVTMHSETHTLGTSNTHFSVAGSHSHSELKD